MPRDARHHVPAAAWWAAALVGLTVLTYGVVVRHDFVNFDDDLLIRDNADFHPVTLRNVIDYWRGPYYGGAFPVTYTFLAMLAALARDANGFIQPALFHATSVALHAANTVIVFLLIRTLIHGEAPAALAAAIYCVHPLQVEAVAWATNLNTLLYGTFSLLAVWLYVLDAMRAKDGRVALGLFAAATTAFVLAMLSKPVAVTLPLVAAALDLGFVRRNWRQVTGPALLWLALAVPVMVATRVLLPAPEIFAPPLWARPLVALDALAFYLGKLLAPVGLNLDYGRTPGWLMSSPALRITWIVPVALLIVLLLVRRRAPELLAAAAVFVVSLLPVLGLTPFHYQQYSTVADRYVYISMLGVALAVAWALVRLPRAASIVVVILVLVFTAWSNIEVRHWRDTDTLFETSVRRNPTSLAAHNVLAFSASQRGDVRRAIEHYEAALRTDPGHAATLYNLGNLVRARGRAAEAVELYRKALVRAPKNPKMHNNLGVALVETGDFDAAVASFESVVRLDPGWIEARENLARAQALQRRAATRPATQPATTPG